MKEFKVGEHFNYYGKEIVAVEDATGNCYDCYFSCGRWCSNTSLKCKNHDWNVRNRRLIFEWTIRERSDNKCVIFKEVKE